MSKYDPLYQWLRSKSVKRISMTFAQIEYVLGFELPASAKDYPAWWANETGSSRHFHCRAWIDAGFMTKNLCFSTQSVDFESFA